MDSTASERNRLYRDGYIDAIDSPGVDMCSSAAVRVMFSLRANTAEIVNRWRVSLLYISDT